MLPSDPATYEMFGSSNDGVRKNILLTPENQSESVHASVQLGLDFPCRDPVPVAPFREDGIVHSLVLNEWPNMEKSKRIDSELVKEMTSRK